MEDKLQWYKVTLLLAALTMVFEPSAGNYFGLGKSRPDKVYLKVHKTDEYSLEQLSILLRQRIEFKDLEVDNRRTDPVLINLAKTMDKDKEGGVLGQFTVNQLLALNDFYKEDCTDDKINERQEFCRLLSNKGNADLNKRWPLYVKFDPAYYELEHYCLRTLDSLQEWCQPRRVELAAKSLKGEIKRLKKFLLVIDYYIITNKIQGRSDKVVREVFGKKDLLQSMLAPEVIDRIPADCNRFLATFKPLFRYHHFSNTQITLLHDCEAIAQLSIDRESPN